VEGAFEAATAEKTRRPVLCWFENFLNMEPERSFKSGIATSTQSPFQRICAAVGQRPRSLWTACAATSLTTSKYLFTKANLNYPVHIHLLQIAVVATYLTVTYVRRSLDGLEGPSRIRSASSWMYLTFLACIMALAVACTLQAILHLHNTTAVVMFSVSHITSLQGPSLTRQVGSVYR
jgi:hypothetical protein